MIELEIHKDLGRMFTYTESVTDAALAAVTDAVVTVELYNGTNKFDWDDFTFKSSGWVTPDLDVPFVRGCTYQVSESFNGTADAIDMTDGDILTTGGTCVVGGVTYQLKPKIYRCSQSLVAGAAQSGRVGVNRTTSRFEIYRVDGTTLLTEMPATDGSNASLTGTGTANTPEKRGAPI